MTDCTGQEIRSHVAKVGEIMVATKGYGGRMRMIGNRTEIACIPHEGCRLEVQEVVQTSDPQVRRLLPLDTITYIQVRFLRMFRRDLFLLPNGREVRLSKLEGFKFRLMSPEISRPPQEEDILRRAHRAREAAGVA